MNEQEMIEMTKMRRLNYLLRQQAHFGAETPPHISMEIDELQNVFGAENDANETENDMAGRLQLLTIAALVSSASALLISIADFMLILLVLGHLK